MKTIIFKPIIEQVISIDSLSPAAIVGMKKDGYKYIFPAIGAGQFIAIMLLLRTCPNRKDGQTGSLKFLLEYYKNMGVTDFYLFETSDELLNWLATHDNV